VQDNFKVEFGKNFEESYTCIIQFHHSYKEQRETEKILIKNRLLTDIQVSPRIVHNLKLIKIRN